MARFFGIVGFGEQTQVRPGIYEDVITEKEYFGDVTRNSLQSRESLETVNNDVFVSHAVEIVADDYANEHIYAIRYVEWAGSLWTVTSVDVRRPRLLLRLGEVYNGTTPAPSSP